MTKSISTGFIRARRRKLATGTKKQRFKKYLLLRQRDLNELSKTSEKFSESSTGKLD